MHPTSIHLPEASQGKLERSADALGVTRSEAIRLAIDLLDERVSGGRGPTISDLVGHLAGSVDGPGESSSKRSRMRGYGLPKNHPKRQVA